MRVLDIDLDFFLADTCPLAEPGCRPCLKGHEPWEKAETRRFLEEKLKLDSKHPIPGRVFETHDGALRFWNGLIGAGKLSVPFEVAHVDAHSDLGIGALGPALVLNGALCQRTDVRCDIKHYCALGQLDEANYLLYALAFRWVSKLENLRNPKSRPDKPPEIVYERDASGVPTALRLVPPLPELFEKLTGPEPVVPYRQYDDAQSYVPAGTFDYMSLAISPRYSPKEVDALIEVLSEYMQPL